MKRLRMIMVTVFLLSVMAAGAYAADGVKIGYADLSRLFDEYHKTKEYDKVLEVKHSELEKIGRDGGYIASPAHAIPADAKPENIAAMIDVLKNQ